MERWNGDVSVRGHIALNYAQGDGEFIWLQK